MKILHTVKKYHPSTGGMYEVVKQLSEKMVSFGHDVTVATSKLPVGYKPNLKGVKIKEFDITGNLVSKMIGNIKEYQNFLIKSNFQIISCFAAQQIMCDAMLPILNKIKAKKVFVPTGFSALYNKNYQNYFENMKNWMKQYDMNVFLSNDYRDINFARKNNIKNYMIIPNGADENEFLKKNNTNIKVKLNIPKNIFFILHIGSHTELKGHYEAIKIFSKAKIKNTTFLIIGNNGTCLQSCKKAEQKLNNSKKYKSNNKKLIIKHLNRAETVAAYKEADLFLFPSNIECSPIVLFECMASKTPFLTTDVGNSKEIIQWSNSGMLLPTKKGIPFDVCSLISLKKYIKRHINDHHNLSTAKIKKSAKLLESLYNNKTTRKKMIKNGYKSWLKKFTWGKIAKDYENLYNNLLNNNL